MGVAAQEREILGFFVNSKELSVSLLPKKIEQIIEICRKARSTIDISLREVAKILGNLAWAIQAIPFAQGHYRNIQWLYITQSARAGGNLSTKIQLDERSRAELDWWSNNVRESNGRPFSVRDPNLIIFSDAVLSGWGASLNDASAKGPWADQDRLRHINELELMAALFALKSFTSMASQVSVRLMMDNATAVHYVNNSGGSRSQRLCRISQEIVAWCERRSITINAEYLPGTQNVVADRLSRAGQDSSDWKLNPSVFSHLRSSLEPKGRLVRIGLEQTAGPVRQLGPATGRNGGGRLQPGLGGRKWLRISPILPDSEMSDESVERPSGAHVGDPLLTSADLVPAATRASVRAGPSSPERTVVAGPSRPTTPAVGIAPVGRLEIVRRQFESSGLSSRVVELLMGGSRNTTSTAYQSAWSNWGDWCVREETNPMSPPIAKVLHFLSSVVSAGKAYRTINVHRSMLSSTLASWTASIWASTHW